MRPAPPENDVPGTIVFHALSGSHAYGTTTSASDADWRGVFLLPSDDFLGLDRPRTTWEDRPHDQVFWEIGHFCKLLLKGNPNIVSMLYTPRGCTVKMTSQFAGLPQMRDQFLSQAMRRAYMSWIPKELDEISRLHKGSAKRLSHVPRLIWEYETALRTRRIEVRQPDARRDVIMAIKTGSWTYDESVAFVGSLVLDVERLDGELGPDLPEPPVEETREWLLTTRRLYG